LRTFLIELRVASSTGAGTNQAEQFSVFGSVKEVRAEDFVQEVFDIVINYCTCEDVHECILITAQIVLAPFV